LSTTACHRFGFELVDRAPPPLPSRASTSTLSSLTGLCLCCCMPPLSYFTEEERNSGWAAFGKILSHYARTPKQRRTLTKKGDTWSARLRRCVTHCNVIGDMRKYASLISQYRRRALETLVSHHIEKLGCAIRVTCLILDDCLSYSSTNRRRIFSKVRLRLSYAPSEFLQATGCILELGNIRQPHSTHIFTVTYKGTYG
jgi:hypothetical protein